MGKLMNQNASKQHNDGRHCSSGHEVGITSDVPFQPEQQNDEQEKE